MVERFMGDHVQTLMMLGGVGLLCWLMMRGRLKARRILDTSSGIPSMKHNANVGRASNGFCGAASTGAPAEVLKWQVELYDLARQLKGELDSKISAVSKLTRDYDQAAVRLHALIAEAHKVKGAQMASTDLAGRLFAAGCTLEQISAGLSVSQDQVKGWLDAAPANLLKAAPVQANGE